MPSGSSSTNVNANHDDGDDDEDELEPQPTRKRQRVGEDSRPMTPELETQDAEGSESGNVSNNYNNVFLKKQMRKMFCCRKLESSKK